MTTACRWAIACILLCGAAGGMVFADSLGNASNTATNGTSQQNAGTTTSTSSSTEPTTTQATSTAPVPYSPDEFPLWAQDLRRAEVISVGVFPFALLYTSLLYDLGRYLVLAVSGSPSASMYAPWFFAPADKPALTGNEKLGIVLGSVGVALVVGIIDFAINSSQRHAAEERRIARAAAAKAAGERQAQSQDSSQRTPQSSTSRAADSAGP